MKSLYGILSIVILSFSACTVIPAETPPGPPVTYYIDALLGNDSAAGNTEATAWQTMDRLVNAPVKAGDTVLFKRGGEYRGSLVPVSGRSGAPTLYGAYGDAATAKPLLLGSVNKSQTANWTVDSGNIYRCDQTSPYDIGNLIFNRHAIIAVGLKKWSKAELTSQGDYFYDPISQALFLYSLGNPASFYSDIECALDRYIINETDRSYLVLENLDLRYGAANGVGGGNTAYITIRHCDFSYIGGALLYTASDGSKIRYGNGVEFQRNAHHNLVENCRFDQIFDTAVTNQSNGEVVQQYNIIYRNNLMQNYGMAAVEIWVRIAGSRVYDITFEHNSCYNSGGGWSFGQNRHSPFGLGHQVISFGSASPPERIYIRNNIFHTAVNPADQSNASAIFIQPMTGQSNTTANFSFDYNCYYNNGSKLAIFWSTEGGAVTTYLTSAPGAYQTGTGQDNHSIFVDPQWTDVDAGDYSLQAGSPCLTAGSAGAAMGADISLF